MGLLSCKFQEVYAVIVFFWVHVVSLNSLTNGLREDWQTYTAVSKNWNTKRTFNQVHIE